MVFFNYALRKLNAKIVYYGPGLCGKTTNLQWIHDHFEGGEKGKMVSLATEGDRTIFFDLLPLEIGRIRGMDVTLQLYTVPGQVHYNSTRQLVLRGADGVVFVADSQKTMRTSNEDSLRNLQENLSLQGINLDEFPHVLQFNKRDLGDLMAIEDMNASLNKQAVPIFDAVAVEGIGVQETLEGIVKLVMRSLKERYEAKTPGLHPEPAAPPSSRPAPWPVAPPVAPVGGSPADTGVIGDARPDSIPHAPFPPAARTEIEPPPMEVEPNREVENDLSPEEVDTHTDILFPGDVERVDELDEIEPGMNVDEFDEIPAEDEHEPREAPVFPEPVSAPPPRRPEPEETGDQSDSAMPFETIDIGTLPVDDVDLKGSVLEPEPVPEHEIHEEGEELQADEYADDAGISEQPVVEASWSDQAGSQVEHPSGVEDLVASILDPPAAEEKPVTEPEEVVAGPEMPNGALVSEDENAPGESEEAVFFQTSAEEGLGGPDEPAFSGFDDEPRGEEGTTPSETESDGGGLEPADPEAVETVAAASPDRRGAPVPVFFDDGDPFGGDEWGLPPAAEKPAVEILAPGRVSDEIAGSKPIDVSVQDNSLALKLTGTGAIVESGQVRAIDIEVPVPGAWVGNNRVTMQLRLTLVPAPEDEDA